MISFNQFLTEDAPTNNIGSGAVKSPDMFMGSRVFDVSNDSYHKALFKGKQKYHKYNSILDDVDASEELRAYAKADTSRKVVLRNSRTGELTFLRRA